MNLEDVEQLLIGGAAEVVLLHLLWTLSRPPLDPL
jgi:hypothetical protein